MAPFTSGPEGLSAVAPSRPPLLNTDFWTVSTVVADLRPVACLLLLLGLSHQQRAVSGPLLTRCDCKALLSGPAGNWCACSVEEAPKVTRESLQRLATVYVTQPQWLLTRPSRGLFSEQEHQGPFLLVSLIRNLTWGGLN